jgi:hypothetical protein
MTSEFNVSAEATYKWCTDYGSDGHSLINNKNARRLINWLTNSTVILKNVFFTSSGIVEKEKLVQLYPDQLIWISTYLTGPNKHSQFIYQILKNNKETSSKF